MLSAKGISVFVPALATKLIDELIHLHCLDVSSKAFRSVVNSMGVA